jgi:hypothetical protein
MELTTARANDAEQLRLWQEEEQRESSEQLAALGSLQVFHVPSVIKHRPSVIIILLLTIRYKNRPFSSVVGKNHCPSVIKNNVMCYIRYRNPSIFHPLYKHLS